MSHDHEHQESARTSAAPEATVGSQPSENSFLEIARFALIALLIVLPIRWFVAQPFIVSGASMENTFHDKEYLIVDQLSYRFAEPKRGDVIIFKYPNDPSKYFIKRIIGLPGETVSLSGAAVTIKNQAHPQGFTLAEPYAQAGHGGRDQDLTLGPDEYFVMGDNRDHSSDSRSWGVLEKDKIVGRAFLRLLPPATIGVFPGAAVVSS